MRETEARAALNSAIAAITDQPALANFLVRGDRLADGQVTRADFEHDLASQVIDDVLSFATSLAERELLPYDPSFQVTSGQALIDDLDNIPDLARIHASTGSPQAPLDSRADDAEPVCALGHRVDGPTGEAVTAYRLKGPGIATRRPRGIRILVPRSGVYERIDEEVLYYQPRFDALVVGSVVLVTAPSTVQRSLGSPERAQQMARETFARATTRLRIDGVDQLIDAVSSDPAMIAKMAQLNRTIEADAAYADALTTANLLDFLDRNPQIPIETTGAGDERRLVFQPNPQQRYLIPKVLADDFLRSELTDRHYEAGSKQRLEG